MAGIIYELIDVLKQEKECYDGLETLAEYTEKAILEKNISFLQEVTQTEEAFIGRVHILGKKRNEMMKDIALVIGKSQQNLTITQIIEKVGEETEVGQTLITLRNSIKMKLDKIQKQSELNKKLLADSLEFVNFTVNALGGVMGSGQMGYAPTIGDESPLPRQQSFFDQKQ